MDTYTILINQSYYHYHIASYIHIFIYAALYTHELVPVCRREPSNKIPLRLRSPLFITL